MTWIKLDDAFFTHDKALQCSDPALLLFLRCLCWTSHHEKDGNVPSAVIATYGDDALASELVTAKFFRVTRAGFKVVNYEKHQRTREQIEAAREAAAERQRRSRVTRKSRTSHGDVTRDKRDVTAQEENREEEITPPTPQGASSTVSVREWELPPPPSVEERERVKAQFLSGPLRAVGE